MLTATKLTFCRIFCAPVVFVLYFLPLWLPDIAVLPALSVYTMIPVLIFAQITDYLDGKYARQYNQVSAFGKVFDPFADVFLNITVFFCLVLSGYMPGIILLLIIYREISMTFVRLVSIQNGVPIGARKGGKAKTVLYIVSCFSALAIESCLRLGFLNADDSAVTIGRIAVIALFILCLAASYISFADYLICFKNVLRQKSN
ncbi:MAG: CDP-diacylglycerol--glycerol-3-phosphate 3-phosphatidyltransferase [Treponemataceae bacterium]|nr:MAG: CDP-diacylglycerol--glycerol-3-phosphate 3-phosphatidyltransferase [Treponemataceae bacterium]